MFFLAFFLFLVKNQHVIKIKIKQFDFDLLNPSVFEHKVVVAYINTSKTNFDFNFEAAIYINLEVKRSCQLKRLLLNTCKLVIGKKIINNQDSNIQSRLQCIDIL